VAARFAALGSLALSAWAAWSCEVTPKNYPTLSYFFDGVPDPNAKGKPGAGLQSPNIQSSPTYSIHKPYADAACIECHSKSYDLTVQDSGICLKCHRDRVNQYPKMHGPVAAVACLWCHTPHESAEAHLLKKPAREVCLQCHDVAALNSDKVPAHVDPARSCIECHSGHGGTAPYFLLPKATRADAPAADTAPKEPASK
jgi:predicted CXXCH cytochrome family protein